MRNAVLSVWAVASSTLFGCYEPFDINDYITHVDGGSQGTLLDGGSDGDAGPFETPTGIWKNVTANLSGLPSECGNVGRIVAKPDEDKLIVGIALSGLWESTDGALTWNPIGRGPGSTMIPNTTTAIIFDPANPRQYWQSGIYHDPGVFRTTDNGETFSALGEIEHNDLVAIDFTDPERKVLVVGSHERSQILYKSMDGGATWENIGVNLPAMKTCTFPMVIDATTYLVGCHYGSEGIHRTTDGGLTWTEVSPIGGKEEPLRASDGSIYWSVENSGGLLRSTDDGQTWTHVTPAGVVQAIAPIELPDKRIVMLGRQTLLASADFGAHWHPVSPQLPYEDVTAIAYSTHQKAFFIKHFTCGRNDPVPNDGIMRFDYE